MSTEPKRKDYVATKGTEVVLLYLFQDEIRYWEQKGYLVTCQPWPKP